MLVDDKVVVARDGKMGVDLEILETGIPISPITIQIFTQRDNIRVDSNRVDVRSSLESREYGQGVIHAMI